MRLFGVRLPWRVPRTAQPYLAAGAILGAGAFAVWALRGTPLGTTLMRRAASLGRSKDDDSPDAGRVRIA